MTIAAVDAYLDGPFREIEGWCSPHLWQAIEPLSDLQDARGVSAPVAEIGVHHGKFLLGLMATRGTATGNLAVDVFDRQDLNIDHSGWGTLGAFRRSLALCGHGPEAVEILQADSLSLGAAQVAALRRRSGGGYAMVSVDGGHTAQHAVHDIRLAMELAVPEGVIMVDDIFRHDWPGVTEGVARLYLMDTPRFVPLIAICNKLFLCQLSFHAVYLQALVKHLKHHFPSTRLKGVDLFGHRMISAFPDEALPAWTSLRSEAR